MNTTHISLGIVALLALTACTDEKEVPSVVPPVPATPTPASNPSTAPEKATPQRSRVTKRIHRSVKKKAPKAKGPTTETIKTPAEIIGTRTIVS